MMIDADHFKRVNDEHGHGVGDAVLIELSQRISALLRTSDLFGRYGGEEFIVLAPMLEDRTHTALAERIREAVGALPLAPERLSVTVSVGCALIQADETLRGALQRADAALYRAKSAGRNRVQSAEAPEDAAADRASTAA